MPPRITRRTRTIRPTFIRAWRDFVGLSQDQLVERVRERVDTFSKSTLSRLENGKQPYTQYTLEAIAWALGREPEDLIMRPPDSEVWSIVDSLKDMEPSEQAQIARIVATFRKAS